MLPKIDQAIAATIDHTVLKVDTDSAAIEQLCTEAKNYGFAAVCVPPHFVKQAVIALQNTKVQVATVVGFPLGYTDVTLKILEIKLAALQGVHEIDAVINVAALKSGQWEILAYEIASIADACRAAKVLSKIIIETAVLNDQEIIKVCSLCAKYAVNYVKTSTGFSKAGATVHHITLMRQALPATIKLKASGGIRTREVAKVLIAAGANRLGCSQGIKIVTL